MKVTKNMNFPLNHSSTEIADCLQCETFTEASAKDVVESMASFVCRPMEFVSTVGESSIHFESQLFDPLAVEVLVREVVENEGQKVLIPYEFLPEEQKDSVELFLINQLGVPSSFGETNKNFKKLFSKNVKRDIYPVVLFLTLEPLKFSLSEIRNLVMNAPICLSFDSSGMETNVSDDLVIEREV
jgi:hypothetical protein